MSRSIFSSESVCAGHPDKICDSISDAILDAALDHDPKSRVAVETLVTTNRVVIAGEISTTSRINVEKIARKRIKELGYSKKMYDFSHKATIEILLHQQSPEIAQGVDNDGAGDQGMMFGYACTETKELMPLPITLAHRLAQRIDQARETLKIPYLRPDGKSQVSIVYENGKPIAVDSVVIAVPHSEHVKPDEVKHDVFNKIVKPVLAKYGYTISKERLIVNGTGAWYIGGPASDTGLTGRKIVVDTYGGYAPVGGGAFSGKDPTKVDRSGAYGARYIAKNIVAAGLAQKAEVRLAYCIGIKKPLMQEVETFGTEKKSKKYINEFANNLLDTSVRGIIEALNLRRPIYLKTSAYGHFGRNEFPWEKTVS